MLDKATFTLSSVESAIFLNEIYDKTFIQENSIAANLIGSSLHYEAESITAHTSYSSIVEMYIKYDIKRFYGLTIDEFLDRDRFTRSILLDKALEKMKDITKKTGDVESNAKQLLRDYLDDHD